MRDKKEKKAKVHRGRKRLFHVKVFTVFCALFMCSVFGVKACVLSAAGNLTVGNLFTVSITQAIAMNNDMPSGFVEETPVIPTVAPTATAAPLKDVADGEVWDGEMPVNQEDIPEVKPETIEIPGYTELTLGKKDTSISLINPKGNPCYFEYIISDDSGKVIYPVDGEETLLIKPGEFINLNVRELLGKGKHEVTFAVRTASLGTQETMNGANQNVTINIK